MVWLWDRGSGGGLRAAGCGCECMECYLLAGVSLLAASATRRDPLQTTKSCPYNNTIDRKQAGDAARALPERAGCWTRGRTVVELGGGGGVEVSRGGAIVLTRADGRSLGQLQPARCAVWHRNGFGGTPTHV